MQKIIGIFILSLFTPFLWGADIGSDTVVTRFNTQQTINSGDRVAGFAALDAGFVFGNTGISGTWDTFFQVSGNVDLSIATLVLNQDLIFSNVSELTLFGNIVGGGHTVEFSSSMMCVPNTSAGNTDCRVQEFATYTQTADVNTLDWSVSDSFLAVGLPSHGSNELLIYSFVNNILTLTDSVNTTPEDVLTVRWHPTLPLLAVGITNATGDELFIYSVDVSGNLTLTDSDNIGNNCNAVAWTRDGTYLAVGTQSNPELYVYPVSVGGILGTRTSFNVTGNRTVNREAMAWSFPGTYLAVGFANGGGFDELRVYEFNSGTGTITALNATSNTGNTTGVSWNPAVGDQDVLAAILAGGNPRLRIFRHDGGAGTLTQIDSASENQNQGNAVSWGPVGNCLAVGKAGNGAAAEFKIYPFDRTPDTLGAPQEFDHGNDGVLSLAWQRSGAFIAIGLDNNDIILYQRLAEAAQDVCYVWSDVNWVLNSNIILKDTCLTFEGLSTIDGRGHCLTLNSTSSMQIGVDSSLLMQNLIIKDLSGHQLAFLDATSTASFKDTKLVLNDDYEIIDGKFDVIGSLKIVGENNAFAYKSDQISRILECGIMKLDNGVTFSYAPSISDNSLLQLTADTSKLVLNSATLHSTSIGLQLDTGILEIEGLSKIMSDGTMASEAIAFGDGSSSANNLTIHLLPAANLELTGFILDNNV